MRLIEDNASFRFNQTGMRKFLGDLECEIMELVWKKAKPTATVREIYEVIYKQRGIAYTTVLTTMSRLAEKGILRIVDRTGLANCYAPAESRDQFIKRSVSHVLKIFMREFPSQCQEYFAQLPGKKINRSIASGSKLRKK